MTKFEIQAGNVIAVPADLLLLKHADSFYGVDEVIANRLVSEGLCSWSDLSIGPGDYALIETLGAIAPKRVLFLGTPPLHSFNYNEMFRFARRAIEIIADLKLQLETITTTIHGTGYGLDPGEALQRLIRGFQEGLSQSNDSIVDKIIFLEREDRTARMLNATLESMKLNTVTATETSAIGPDRAKVSGELIASSTRMTSETQTLLKPVGMSSTNKRRAFVALPFTEEFQNVYEFGIYPAVRNCGLICERVDETHFTGDVLSRIRESIEVASFVIADLTGGRPNVYLEVGYAWGRGVPVIFVARKGEQLHFDVSTHRCIFYGKFTQFAKDLEELIRGIKISPPE